MPFVAAGAVTGIGSLPLTSVSVGNSVGCRIFAGSPFWPQLPQLSERESIIGQGLGIVEDLIEPRNEGYGYQVKDGQLDSVLEILHRSSGELTRRTRQDSARSKKRCHPVFSVLRSPSKGRSRAPSRCRRICSTRAGPSCPIRHFFPPSRFMFRRSSAGRLIA